MEPDAPARLRSDLRERLQSSNKQAAIEFYYELLSSGHSVGEILNAMGPVRCESERDDSACIALVIARDPQSEFDNAAAELISELGDLRSENWEQFLHNGTLRTVPNVVGSAGTQISTGHEPAIHSGEQEPLRSGKFPRAAKRIAVMALYTVAIASASIAGFSMLHSGHEAEVFAIPHSPATRSEAAAQISEPETQVVNAALSPAPKPLQPVEPTAHQPIPAIAQPPSMARTESPESDLRSDTEQPENAKPIDVMGPVLSDPATLEQAPTIPPTQSANIDHDLGPAQPAVDKPTEAVRAMLTKAIEAGPKLPALVQAPAAGQARPRPEEARHDVTSEANLAEAARPSRLDVVLPPARETAIAAAPPHIGEITPEERHITADEANALFARGDTFLAAGDLASARLFYEYAASAGNAAAALRLGGTFDPAFLVRARIGRVQGHLPSALYWYRRARDLGNSDAKILLRAMENPAR
jgi:hypothetical protein